MPKLGGCGEVTAPRQRQGDLEFWPTEREHIAVEIQISRHTTAGTTRSATTGRVNTLQTV